MNYTNTEEEYKALYKEQYLPFMMSMQSSELVVSDNVRLHYRFHIPGNATRFVLIMPGRAESAIKYAEVCYDLVQAGYAILIYDHRGQGLSTRQVPMIGHVEDFRLYQHDAIAICESVLPKLNQSGLPVHLLAHSMGGAIGVSLLIEKQSLFESAVLSAPMFGIQAPIPAKIASLIARLSKVLASFYAQKVSYFLGQGDFQPSGFESNNLTTCRQRYECFIQTHKDMPELQLGGISNQWLIQAIKLMAFIEAKANTIDLPVKILLAENDQIVDNSSILRFISSAKYCKSETLSSSQHEILFEQDEIRREALGYIFEFFDSSK